MLALLDMGFPPDAQSRERWTALDDAITLKDKELVKVLHSRQTAAVKADLKAKKGQLLDSLNSMPNVSFQVCILPVPVLPGQTNLPFKVHSFLPATKALLKTFK